MRQSGVGGVGAARSVIAGVQCLLLLASTSCVPLGASPPQPGVLEYAQPLFFELPGGRVNLAGGNLVLRRTDFSLDTLFGRLEVGAVYNSSTGFWSWPFGMRFDGLTFVDDTGAVHDLSSLVDGAAIAGTHWVKLDDQRIKTKGGFVYHFGVLHQLVAMTGTQGARRRGEPMPHRIPLPAPLRHRVRRGGMRERTRGPGGAAH